LNWPTIRAAGRSAFSSNRSLDFIFPRRGSDRLGKLQRLKELASHVTSSSSSAVYSGFVGHDNLGDEVLWDQIRGAFAPMKLICAPPRTSHLRNRIIGLKKHDKVILGGGTLIGANLPDGSNPFREEFHWFFSNARHVAAYGTGVGKLPEKPEERTWLMEWKPLLEKFDYIGVRGPQSVESLAAIGIDAELMGDPACLISKGPGFWAPPRSNPKILGINLGPVQWRNDLDRAKERNFVEVLSGIVQQRAKDGWQIEFFAVTPDDLRLIDEVIAISSVRDCKIHKIYHSGDEYLDAVKHVSAFLGMKLHSVVLAMCAGVPSIMVAYAPKCHDFMKSFDLGHLAIDLGDANAQALNGLLEQIMGSAGPISDQITARMGHYRTLQRDRAAMLRTRFSQP
jgi:polysaccharide pyruvyl transferase WcaK-like protein